MGSAVEQVNWEQLNSLAWKIARESLAKVAIETRNEMKNINTRPFISGTSSASGRTWAFRRHLPGLPLSYASLVLARKFHKTFPFDCNHLGKTVLHHHHHPLYKPRRTLNHSHNKSECQKCQKYQRAQSHGSSCVIFRSLGRHKRSINRFYYTFALFRERNPN